MYQQGKYTFAKPFTFEGKEYKEISLDLDALTGADMLLAERQFNAIEGNNQTFVPVKELSKEFQSIIAAMAAKLPFEFMKALPANDFAKVTTQVQNFLLG